MTDPIEQKVSRFMQERNWQHTGREKDLAMSIAIEAAELMEAFQWLDNDVAIEKNFENIKEELADVVIYSYRLATKLGLDMEDIVTEKLIKNNVKYPVTHPIED